MRPLIFKLQHSGGVNSTVKFAIFRKWVTDGHNNFEKRQRPDRPADIGCKNMPADPFRSPTRCKPLFAPSRHILSFRAFIHSEYDRGKRYYK